MWKQNHQLLHSFSTDPYLDYSGRVLTFQIEHSMSIHAVNKQVGRTELPIADVSPSMVEEV